MRAEDKKINGRGLIGCTHWPLWRTILERVSVQAGIA
jgi:hypothetical protein